MRSNVKQQGTSDRHAPRRGILSAEIVLVLPILALVLFGLFEFALLFSARRELNAAAAVGARKATLPGVTQAEVEAEVRRVLAPHLQDSLQLGVDSGQRSGDLVTVGLAVDMAATAPDLLWPIGYSLKNRQLFATVRMVRE